MLGRGHAREDAAQARQRIDGRIVVRLRQLARQIDVAVEDGADLFADRVAAFLVLDQHGVEGGDRAALDRARPLEQPGQFGEDRRRKAAPHGRFADRQADLAQRAGEAGDGVHLQHDAQALGAEAFGDGGGGVGGADALHRRAV
ncbi:hypothetical protein D3C73_1328470 [compost metagenome]